VGAIALLSSLQPDDNTLRHPTNNAEAATTTFLSMTLTPRTSGQAMANLAKASPYGLAERPYISNHPSLTAYSADDLTLYAAARKHSLSRRHQLQSTKTLKVWFY
jgi:hypothetical protein